MTIKDIESTYTKRKNERDRKIKNLSKQIEESKKRASQLEKKVEDAVSEADLDAYSKLKDELKKETDLIDLSEKAIRKINSASFYSLDEMREIRDSIIQDINDQTGPALEKQKALADQIRDIGRPIYERIDFAQRLFEEIERVTDPHPGMTFTLFNAYDNPCVMLGQGCVNLVGYRENQLGPKFFYGKDSQ